MHATRTIRGTPSTGGFTIIELLVVIGVISLLLTLLTAAGAKLIESQRGHNSEQIMRNVTQALEQFATEAPLRSTYNIKGSETFGKYIPYQLANAATPDSVALKLEASHKLLGINTRPTSLAQRLSLDMSGDPTCVQDDWVQINAPPAVNYDPAVGDGLDDSRALYAYLKVFSPALLDLIPEEYIKPLYPNATIAQRSYANLHGRPFTPGVYDAGVHDILAIHDAWGVPLDYMLYAKYEWKLPEGAAFPEYVVTQRRPVLRSLGIKRDVYDREVNDVLVAANPSTYQAFDPEKWLFSEPLPSPTAGLNEWSGSPPSPPPSYAQNGQLPNPPANPVSTSNGWSRVVGLGESYFYLPPGERDYYLSYFN